jgi:hypothetical protein
MGSAEKVADRPPPPPLPQAAQPQPQQARKFPDLPARQGPRAEPATGSNPAPPQIAGYRQIDPAKVQEVNEVKFVEERLLRYIDDILATQGDAYDKRAAAIARSNLEQGFSWLVRSILKPERIKLPGEQP